MTRIVLAFALLAVLASAADIASTSNSLTSGSFAAAPATKVIDSTTTTAADYASWGTDYDAVKFGPGADNGTIYAYGIDRSSTAFTKLISRSLNATLLSNGTAATAASDAKIGTDGVYSPAATTLATPVWGVGLGSVAVAYAQIDTATVPCAQLFVTVVNGGGSSALVTKQVTSNTCTKCTTATAATTGTGYVISPANVYYDNGTYWVSYTQTLFTATSDGSTASLCSAAPVATATGVVVTNYKSYINGVAATSTGTLAYTTVPELYTSTANAPSGLMCGPSNYTNSTNIYCAYKDGTGSTANLILQPVALTAGTKGTAVTLATDSTAGTSGSADYLVKVYTLAGFIYSQYQQGVLINNLTTSGATPTYSNNLNIYNTTSGAATQTAGGAIVGTTYTTATSAGAFTGAGISWGTGYAIIDGYVSSTSTTPNTYTWEYGSFLSNSTANVSKTTIGTVQGTTPSFFVDANGALWFGAYAYDTVNSGGLTSATIGKLVAQLYTSGQALASFFALLSLMIAAVLAF